MDTLIEVERILTLPQAPDGSRIDWQGGRTIGPDYSVTPMTRTETLPFLTRFAA